MDRPEFRRGLSPLARGTPLYVTLEILSRRFIPAGAGNTAYPYLAITLFTVYPRWRGEHPNYTLIVNQKIGLSPLARGTPTNNRGIILY
ncbi:hypothetical protein A464_2975 [Salmonella bongori N268-08]|uniref:Uncharacterized protein n=1 Tax=Salmonella bongori N268-08 TaxID=1197719 RepID=S5MZX8_SALBN|nr:hypothetical protein A464_2975 [Salmonella bongori N268-08]